MEKMKQINWVPSEGKNRMLLGYLDVKRNSDLIGPEKMVPMSDEMCYG